MLLNVHWICTIPCNTFFFSFFFVFTGLAIFIFPFIFRTLHPRYFLFYNSSACQIKDLFITFTFVSVSTAVSLCLCPTRHTIVCRLRHSHRLSPFYAVFFLVIAKPFLPRLVLAFVFVLCPRAGRLRLWRNPLYEPISCKRLIFIVTSRRRSPSI